MIGPLLRRTAFWAIDLFKGQPVKRAMKDIENKMNGNTDFKEELEKLLRYSYATVPFYRKLAQSGGERMRLQDFPTRTKADYKTCYEDYLSEEYMGQSLHEMSTSGSTGTPFIVKMNREKRNRVIAELIYFNEIARQRIGDRYMYLKTWKERKSRLESFAQNVVAIDILKLNEKTLSFIREKLRSDRRIRSVLAYASTYEVLGSYLSEKKDKAEDFNLHAIFTSSTLMDSRTKKQLETLFGCPVIDRYSNQENGVLAQTKAYEQIYRINRANYIVELLSLRSDAPAEPGEIGRVVVTDLYNFAMPMIRYDTGDLAVSDDIERNHLSTLRNLEGRRVDMIYDTEGNPLTPHTWSVHMRKYEKVKQWQFIQEEEKKYRLKINGGEEVYTEEDFRRTLRTVLGEDAQITVEFLDAIPVLASGKFKNTICLYHPPNSAGMDFPV